MKADLENKITGVNVAETISDGDPKFQGFKVELNELKKLSKNYKKFRNFNNEEKHKQNVLNIPTNLMKDQLQLQFNHTTNSIYQFLLKNGEIPFPGE